MSKITIQETIKELKKRPKIEERGVREEKSFESIQTKEEEIEVRPGPREKKRKEFLLKEETLKKDELNSRREEQLLIGKDLAMAFKLLDEEDLLKSKRNIVPFESSEEQIKKARGRPRKLIKDSIKLTLTLPRKYVEFLTLHEISESKNSTKKGKRKNEGSGGRIRKIIDHYLIMKKREEKQLKNFRRIINELNAPLSEFMNKFEVAKNFEQLEELLARLDQLVRQLQTLKNVMNFDMDDLKILLSEKEWKKLNLALTVLENRQGGSISRGIV